MAWMSGGGTSRSSEEQVVVAHPPKSSPDPGNARCFPASAVWVIWLDTELDTEHNSHTES